MLSGIELNVGKTEIQRLKERTTHTEFIPTHVIINGQRIVTSESIKICGITFSSNANIEYDNNVKDKINKLEKQLIMWLPRSLSVEGKILITKTFGLSQLIYSFQMCKVEENDLLRIERLIYKFLWNKKWVGNQAPDRIKRSILKLSYEKGGLQVPDIGIL